MTLTVILVICQLPTLEVLCVCNLQHQTYVDDMLHTPIACILQDIEENMEGYSDELCGIAKFIFEVCLVGNPTLYPTKYA